MKKDGGSYLNLELEVYRMRFGGGEFALFGLGCRRDCLPFQQQNGGA